MATPPFKHYPKWSEARFWGFVRSALRRAWTRWPPKYELLAEAKRIVPKNKNTRHKFEYQCTECKEWFANKDIEVDHIIPAGSLKCYQDLPKFVERLFVGKEYLRVVCKPCHKRITNEEKQKNLAKSKR